MARCDIRQKFPYCNKNGTSYNSTKGGVKNRMEKSALQEILQALELHSTQMERLEEQLKGFEERLERIERKIDSSTAVLPKQRKMLIYF